MSTEKSCRHCGSLFIAKSAELKRGGAKYCSPRCCYQDRTRSVAERLWEKVQKTDGCWLWTGALNKAPGAKWSYGVIGIGGGASSRLVHRLSWELANGPIPVGMSVCHHCDVPNCVRPDHLFLGTAADNARDMIEKGRNASLRLPRPSMRKPRSHRYNLGEDNAAAKLTAAQVLELRDRHSRGDVTQRQLAKDYGVSPQLVWAILSRRVWADL